MRNIQILENHDMYRRWIPVTELNAAAKRKAEEQFIYYQTKGVIRNGSFQDTVWTLYNELHLYTLDFSLNRAVYSVQWIGCDADSYLGSMKIYIALQLGKYTAQYLQSLQREFLRLSCLKYESVCTDIEYGTQAAEFLSLLPSASTLRDSVIEQLEERSWSIQTGGQRKLAAFRQYIRFGTTLSEFWKYTTDAERIEWFPLWFWWNLTAILPLRVTEFLTTPRECLCQKDDRYLLTVRRSRLKKHRTALEYTLQSDYELHTYEIPENMFREISDYLSLTQRHRQSVLETLLIPTPQSNYGYFTYFQLSALLKKFCNIYMNDKAFPVHLGDTRHLAMISLILSGGSPVICRELAGHESINISSHYYANLSTVVESAVYELYSRSGKELQFDGTPRTRMQENQHDSLFICNGGFCDVQAVSAGDMTECLKSCSTAGHIGECISCSHFHPKEMGMRLQLEKQLSRQVNEDGQYLMQMIEIVRKGLGYTEDIQGALLRLQHSAARYGTMLKYRLEEDENGAPTKM